MKARPRPSPLSLLLLCCAMCFVLSETVIPTSHAYGKTRTEVQQGDPTDTDPGPAPTTTGKAARLAQLSTREAAAPGVISGALLKFWLTFFLARYWSR